MHISAQGVPQWYSIEFVRKPAGRGICGFMGIRGNANPYDSGWQEYFSKRSIRTYYPANVTFYNQCIFS
jgi:hypothetical protein